MYEYTSSNIHYTRIAVRQSTNVIVPVSLTISHIISDKPFLHFFSFIFLSFKSIVFELKDL